MKSLLEKTEHNDVVIGVFRQSGLFKAVAVKRTADSFELLWHRKSSTSQTGWDQFCAQIVSADLKEQLAPLILGYDSGNVVFYNIQVPVVKASQLDTIVKMQAETLLPLPIDQMQLAWQLNESDGNINCVTIAAAKRDELVEFVQAGQVCQPRRIVLDCSGVAKSWNRFFAPGYPQAKTVLVYTKADKTQVCLLESGHLSRITTLTYKLEQLSDSDTTAMFINDLHNTLDDFGCAATNDVGIFVLSEEKTIAKNLAAVLSQQGINAQNALADAQVLSSFENLSPELLAEFIVPIGLCLCGLDTQDEQLNLFEDLYQSPQEKCKTGKSDDQVKKLSIVAAILLLALVLICFASDKIKLAQLEKYFNDTDPNSNIAQLVEKQKLRKKIAVQRPSMLDLLMKINKDRDETLLLDSIEFKKGRRSSITGHTKDNSSLAKFAESLAKQKGIKEVRIQSQAFDEKKKLLGFTITFHYKGFTKKKKI